MLFLILTRDNIQSLIPIKYIGRTPYKGMKYFGEFVRLAKKLLSLQSILHIEWVVDTVKQSSIGSKEKYLDNGKYSIIF